MVHTWSDVCLGRVLCQVRCPRLLQTPVLPGGLAGEVREADRDRPHPDPLQLRLLCQSRAREQVRTHSSK